MSSSASVPEAVLSGACRFPLGSCNPAREGRGRGGGRPAREARGKAVLLKRWLGGSGGGGREAAAAAARARRPGGAECRCV